MIPAGQTRGGAWLGLEAREARREWAAGRASAATKTCPSPAPIARFAGQPPRQGWQGVISDAPLQWPPSSRPTAQPLQGSADLASSAKSAPRTSANETITTSMRRVGIGAMGLRGGPTDQQ